MKAMRHEKSNFAGQKFQKSGLTLVELLVVVTIMAILLAVSIPAIRPMLETQKTRDAANTVSTFLAQARLRAIETGLPCGVRFERYLGLEMQDSNNMKYYPYNGACLQMRQVAVPRPYGGCVEGMKVSISNNTSYFINSTDFTSTDDAPNYQTDEEHLQRVLNWKWYIDLSIPAAEQAYWGTVVQDGDWIQFDYQGPKYLLNNCANSPRIDVTFLRDVGQPKNPPITKFSALQNASTCSFKIYRQAKPTLVAPVRFPQGIVIDLNSSGKEKTKVVSLSPPATSKFFDQEPDHPFDFNAGTGNVARDDFAPSSPMDTTPVTIMFLPNGEVDRSTYSYSRCSDSSQDDSNYPIFVCIGLWDRMGYWRETPGSPPTFTISNDYLPDDKLWNYRDLNNFWVAVFPKSGNSTVQPMTVSTYTGDSVQNLALEASREYAKNQQGIGGR